MMNLMDLIDLKLNEYQLPPISNVVNNKQKSIRYINKLLKEYGNTVDIPFALNINKYDFRIKHILFSFGLGVVIASFCKLSSKIEESYKNNYKIDKAFIYAWLTVCLYHDFGYFVGSSYIKTDDIEDLVLGHKIFDYSYCSSRYSKSLYIEYYKNKYSTQNWDKCEYDIRKNEEVGDHGILGGYILFERLCSSETQNSNSIINNVDSTTKDTISFRIPFYQDICFRIMEHNIWKNNSVLENDHPFREIDKENFQIIEYKEPLLYLLSLVDTIEMTKRFCTYIDDSEEKEKFIYPKTLGKKIKVDITSGQIRIDYSEMDTFIRTNNYFNNVDNWVSAVVSLKEWVDVDSSNTKQVVHISKSIDT